MKPSAIAKSIKVLHANRRPGFVWGPPGVGKSDVMGQVASDLGVQLRDVRMSLMDPTDIKGFPMIKEATRPYIPAAAPIKPMGKVTKQQTSDYALALDAHNINEKTRKAHHATLGPLEQMKWAAPDFLPTEGEGILFLDELPTADRATQAAAYQLVLNRRVGDYELPAGWSVFAAGNRAGDGGVHHAMPAPLANRFVHLDYTVDPQDWQTWALHHNVSDITRGFIAFRTDLLHKHDPSAKERAFPTPRSWVFVDSVRSQDLDQETELELIKGTVGEGAAVEYYAFARAAKDLPKVAEILLNPDSAPMPTSPSSKFAICTALDRQTEPTNAARLLRYMQRMDTEFQVLYMRGACHANRANMDVKEVNDWITNNHEVLV